MQTVNAVCGNARTFLTHLFGAGLDDEDRYVVERFRSYVAQQIMLRSSWIPCCRAGGAVLCAT